MKLGPTASLGSFPTNLEPAAALGEVIGQENLWLKRDDLTGFGWGGNKVRAVEFLLGDALARRSTTVVMAAGPSSNFAVTMAAASRTAGLEVEQICYGDPPEIEPHALRHARALGVRVHFTNDTDRSTMEAEAERRAAQLRREQKTPYVIPRGGATPVGSQGFVAAARELAGQLKVAGLVSPHVVLPVGSAGSLAGLLVGRQWLGEDWQITGVSVSRSPSSIRDQVAEHARACARNLGVGEIDFDSVDIVDGRGAGFNQRDASEDLLIERVELACGLLIDPVYNAKTLGWLAQAQLRGPVVYWHTGGLLGVADRMFPERGSANRE